MAMLKHELASSISKKTLTIEEKIKPLDADKKTRQSCRQLAEQFRIGKTAAAKIIKNKASIRQEYERFKGPYIYDIHEKCPIFAPPSTTFSVCPNGSELGKTPPPLDVQT